MLCICCADGQGYSKHKTREQENTGISLNAPISVDLVLDPAVAL